MKFLNKTIPLLIAMAVLLGLAGPGSGRSQDRYAGVQPALIEAARANPDQLVSVIVQKAGTDQQAVEMAKSLGGKITSNLHIINAFAVKMPAGKALQLAVDNSVRWASMDRPIESSKKPVKDASTEMPPNTYLDTLDVQDAWEMGYTGKGVTIAFIDSGVSQMQDFLVSGSPNSRLVETISFNNSSTTVNDTYGHGTHVAGIAAGSGQLSDGVYMGIAPDADLISLKIADETGVAYESDVVTAMQWVLENKDAYNIRVVNLSIQSANESSYHESPMDAAMEILWFNGVVVVVSAGNWGDAGYNPIHSAPANDPFVITVGAIDEDGTSRTRDDSVAEFSASGQTLDAYSKPEIHAPGVDIVSVLSKLSDWDLTYPERAVYVNYQAEYIRLSGTSMSTPMVTGAAALLLQAEPELNPDQVKYRLINTAYEVENGAALDVYEALTTPTTETANTGLEASKLLWTGDDPIAWDSVNWGSVNWGSVNWGSVNWGSVNWGSVNWGSVNWGSSGMK